MALVGVVALGALAATMTDSEVEATIEFGKTAKAKDFEGFTLEATHMSLISRHDHIPEGPSPKLFLSTPWERIARASMNATAKHQSLTAGNVPESMRRPILRVLCPGVQTTDWWIWTCNSVTLARGGRDDDIIQPTTAQLTELEWQPSRRKADAILATFPMDVLAVGNEFRILLSTGATERARIDAEIMAKLH